MLILAPLYPVDNDSFVSHRPDRLRHVFCARTDSGLFAGNEKDKSHHDSPLNS